MAVKEDIMCFMDWSRDSSTGGFGRVGVIVLSIVSGGICMIDWSAARVDSISLLKMADGDDEGDRGAISSSELSYEVSDVGSGVEFELALFCVVGVVCSLVEVSVCLRVLIGLVRGRFCCSESSLDSSLESARVISSIVKSCLSILACWAMLSSVSFLMAISESVFACRCCVS